MLPRKRPRPTQQEAVKLIVRVATICARTFFWAVCFHYFGSKAVLYVVAAWAFVGVSRDLTFARVRLANMAVPEKRQRAIIKSAALEIFLLLLRLGLIALIGHVLLRFNPAVAAIVSGLMLCAVFWARETLITLVRAYKVTSLSKYVTLLAALSGLGAIILFAEWNFNPEKAAVGAILVREGVLFFGYVAIAVIGRTTNWLRDAGRGEEDEDSDEEGDGGTVSVLDAEGQRIRSTFKIFIADNVVHSRWRAMQFGTRALAHGLMGPFGTILTRLFFTYRTPGPYVHRESRTSRGKMVLMAVGSAAVLAVALTVAHRYGLLHAAKIAGAAFALRAVVLGLNILLWARLRSLIGTGVKVRWPKWSSGRSGERGRRTGSD